ncbi:SOS response-associated peptidase [Aestuariivirga sp.]|uniref:SOS response-associated peptidase n=1 Tax=Aestuariivirga sp. TaxID=2650926 RepID=UPI0039E3E7CD
MCGLYSFRANAEEARNLFGYVDEPDFPPRSHVAPGSPVAIVRMEQGQRCFALVRWGFIPSWVKEVKPGKPLINARGETVMEKPSFRNAMKRRRCLIPADGFYEWQGDVPGRKTQWFIHRPNDAPFAFAGLWEHWMGANGSEIETAVILTCAPNEMISRIYTRMPVVIAEKDFETWLTGDEDEALKLIRPAAEGFFTMEPAETSRRVPPPKPESGQMNLF